MALFVDFFTVDLPPKRCFLSQLKASLVVVSDIHLHSPDDARGRALLKLLAEVEQGEVAHLVLLGDIFDFCLGSHRFFQKKFAPIGSALEKVVQSGTEVTYIEGNHEFRLMDLPWRGVTVIPHGTHYLKLQNGMSVQAAHGDMIFSHRRYKAFRWLVKSWLVTTVASFLPGRWMDGLARKGSEVSRSADQYRTIQHDKILGAVDRWLEAGGAHYGIFGHFHVPYAEPRRDLGPGGVMSVDCWDRPNALIFKQDGIYRLWLNAGGDQWEPAQPLVRKAESVPAPV